MICTTADAEMMENSRDIVDRDRQNPLFMELTIKFNQRRYS